MQIVAGGIPLGEDFYNGRLKSVDDLKIKLIKNDVLLIGPRRTGKTSVIKEYLRQEKLADENFYSIFIDLEKAQNLYEFYFLILRELYQTCKKWKLLANDGMDFLKGLSSLCSEFFDGGIDSSTLLGLPPGSSLNIKFPKFEKEEQEKLKILSAKLRSELDGIKENITIVLDEFPELIWKFGQTEEKELQFESRKLQTQFLLEIIPIVVNYHLTAKNIVKELSEEIQKQTKQFHFKNEIEGNKSLGLKYVLIFDGIDRLYNIFSHDGARKSPKRAHGGGSPIFQKIQYSSELRSFLIENTDKVTIIGTSKYTDFMTDEGLPFFNFFNIINIKSLEHDEAIHYALKKIKKNNMANKLFDLTNSYENKHGINICDGKISYLNLYVGSILEAVQQGINDYEKLIRYFYSLFFTKITPYINNQIEQLSEGEKQLLDAIINLSERFYLKDLPEIGLNNSKLMKNLVNKEILTVEGRGTNRIFQISSLILKMWIKYKRDPNYIFLN